MKKKLLVLVTVILSLALTSCAFVTVSVDDTGTEKQNINQTPQTTSQPESRKTSDKTEASSETSDTTSAVIDREEQISETVEPTPVDTESADTEQTEDTDAEEQPIVPGQSYVGCWYKEEIRDSWLKIVKVNSELVAFNYHLTKYIDITAIAVRVGDSYVFGESISPEFDYSYYSPAMDNDSEIKGSIEFFEDRVSFIVETDGYEISELTVKTELLIYTEVSDGNTSPHIAEYDECCMLLEDEIKLSINDTMDRLYHQGWIDTTPIANEVDSKIRWGIELKPYDEDYAVELYSVIGTCGDVSAVVRITYDDTIDEWTATDVYYVNVGGKALQGEELRELISVNGKPSLLLAPDDADLVKYFEDLETAADGTDISE